MYRLEIIRREHIPHFRVGKQETQGPCYRNDRPAHEPSRIEFEKRRIENQPVDESPPCTFRTVKRRQQSAGRMAYQGDVGIAVGQYNVYRRIHLREILLHAAAVVKVLVRHPRTPVFPQVEGIEIPAMPCEMPPHMVLEVIIQITVYIEHRRSGGRLRPQRNDRRRNGPLVIVGQLHHPRFMSVILHDRPFLLYPEKDPVERITHTAADDQHHVYSHIDERKLVCRERFARHGQE
jgi:hypothetical protein